MNDDSNDGVARLAHQLDHERISRRAYEIYESRHRTDGHAEEDWFQAKAEDAQLREDGPVPAGHYGPGSSYGDRTRKARR
jgi:Protein of unknown function (DUF2934)